MQIDMSTLALVLGITNLLQVLVFAQQYRANKSYSGVKWWLFWSLAAAAGFAGHVLRMFPNFLVYAIMIQNIMLTLGTVFLYAGIMRFLGKKENRKFWVSFTAIYAVFFLSFLFISDNIAVRGLITSLALVVTSGASAYALLKHRNVKLSTGAAWLAASFILHGSLLLVRFVVLAYDPSLSEVYRPTAINIINYLDALVMGLLWSFGLIIMLNQRIKNEAVEAGQQFETIFGASPDGAVISRLEDGVIIEINPGFTALTGYSREESVGRSSLEVSLWKDPADRDKVTAELRQKGVCDNFEALFLRKDGSVLTGLISARIILLQGQKHILSVTRDISSRKQGEEQISAQNAALAESEGRYRSLFENRHSVMLIINPDDGSIIDANPAAVNYYGWSRKELLNKKISQINTLSPEEVTAEMQAALTEKRAYFNFNHCRADGSVRQVEVFSGPIDLSKKKYLYSIVHDVTERKAVEAKLQEMNAELKAAKDMLNDSLRTSERSRLALLSVLEDAKKAEQELRESEERFKALHNASFGGIAIHDKGLILECNQGLSEMTGYSREELIGMDGMLLIDRDSRDLVMENILSGHEKPYEVTGLRKNGETYPLRLEGRGIPYKGKSVRAVEFRDITESKRAENLQRALYQISDAAIGCRDLQQLYIQVHKTIAKLMPAENLYIAIYDQKSKNIDFPYYRDQKKDYHQPRRFGKGLTEYIITTQKPLLVNKQVHDQLEKEGKAQFVGQPSKQWLGVPLQSENNAFGALVVQSYDEKAEYTQKDLELLNFVAGHVAAAILSIKAEQELADSETRYRTFMDSATDIAFLKDHEFRYLMVNKAQLEFFARPADQILGKTDYDLMPKEAAQACRLSDQMVLESKQTMLSHEPVGNKIYEARKFPVELQNGKTGVGAYIRDITEQQRADQAIRESREKYRDLVETINDAVFSIGTDGIITYISPAIKQIAGYDPQEIVGNYFPRFIHPEDREMVAGEFKNKIAGKLHPIEYRVVAKDCSIHWVSSSIRVVKEDGKPEMLNGIMRDITQRKQAEDQIKFASQKWETTFDSIGDGVCLLDRQGLIIQCNNAFSRMVKKPFDKILGSAYYFVMQGIESPDENCPVVRMAKSYHREVQEMELEGRYLLLSVDPIIDTNKELIGAVYIISDISERKLMEQELLQAQKMEAVGFLAGGVAHDFNNMLAGIMGNAELLQLKVYGQKELETYVENIIKASGHAAGLTKQLLAFARKGQYQQVPVNVHKVIAETLGILGNTIDRRIKIEQHLRANPAVILGDHSQLENALMNLGINARDAMPEGGKLIFSTDLVNLDREYILQHNYKIEPGHYIQISVDDTGSGMSEEVKRHLFEPFFTTKEKGRGTGLGLAGVYGCIKNHGGSVEVYSEPGRGTAIKLYLPLYGDLASEDQGFGQPQDQTPAPGTGSILVVDDEDMIRTIAAQILKTAGYRVQTCADGQEAVELYARDHGSIDLVIMDMVMPKVDGREAFNRMRKIEPRVKMLLSSGFSEDGDAQAILEDGALGFIQKPYRSAELLLRVQQALQVTPNQSLRGNPPA